MRTAFYGLYEVFTFGTLYILQDASDKVTQGKDRLLAKPSARCALVIHAIASGYWAGPT